MAATERKQRQPGAARAGAAPSARAGGAPAGAAPAAEEARRERLLALRVSRIIDAHEAALDALVSGGFAPLANPVARLAMAHTVTLAQAFRIRGMSEEEEEALTLRLLELGVDRRGA